MFNSCRKLPGRIFLGGGFIACLLCGTFALGQTNKVKIPAGFSGKKVTYSHYEGDLPRALITAQDVKPLAGGNILAQQFSLATFRDGQPTNIEAVIEAPECVFNIDSHVASSTNRLNLYNGATNLFIEGRGFMWQPGPTNILTISNDVHTLIRKVTNAPVATESALHIYSDRFAFVAVLNTNINTRIAYYTQNVRAEDPQMRLTSESLMADLSATNDVNNIVAETNVTIFSKSDNSRATGQRAVYRKQDGKRLIELTGNPEWHDAKNEGRARRFLVNPDDRMVWLEGNAQMKLPQSSVAQPDLLGFAGDNTGKTNEPILISAELLNIDATNKTGRTLVGRTNVVIVAQGTRATADAAYFSEALGTLLLTNGTWGGDQFVAKGALLTLDRSNKVFRAERDAFLKLPAKSFGDAGGKKKSNRPDTRFIEILSHEYEVRTNIAVFHGAVRVTFPDTNGVSTLKCDDLTVRFVNKKVQSLVAEGHVDMHQKLSERDKSITRQLNCGKLTVKQRPSGAIEIITAEDNVIGDEVSQSTTTNKVSNKKISAAIVEIHFGSGTNQIEKLIAKKNVFIEQDRSWAQGDELIYTNSGDKEVADLIGNPKVLLVKPGRAPVPMTAEEAISWDLKTDVVKTKGVLKANVVTPPKKKPAAKTP